MESETECDLLNLEEPLFFKDEELLEEVDLFLNETYRRTLAILAPSRRRNFSGENLPDFGSRKTQKTMIGLFLFLDFPAADWSELKLTLLPELNFVDISFLFGEFVMIFEEREREGRKEKKAI